MGARTAISAVAVGAILVVGTIAFGAVGFAVASDRISGADKTLNTVISHQNQLTATFADIDMQLQSLTGSSAFNPQQALALVDKAIADSKNAVTTIDNDTASLIAEAHRLEEIRWMAMVSRGSLDDESSRLGHARAALAAARTVSTDEVLDGSFWHPLYSSLVDLGTLTTQSNAGDVAGETATLATMKSDVAETVKQSTAPGLPADLQALMVDFQTFVADYGLELDAQKAGDNAGVARHAADVQNDLNRISSYDVDAMGTEIDAFYKPLIERFNSEMAAATA
jgi:hypothetical protein